MKTETVQLEDVPFTDKCIYFPHILNAAVPDRAHVCISQALVTGKASCMPKTSL